MAGQIRQSSAETTQGILERGNIYFFYRPKVEVEVVRGPDDVQRLHMILGAQPRRSYRLIIIGEKRLPAVSPEQDRKSWGFVYKVGRRPEDVEDELDPKTYLTETRGERRLAAARPAGEGVYAIVRHGDHTHLAYALELPDKRGAVQRALNVMDEASYIVSVKNPDAPSPPGVGLDDTRKVDYPPALKQRFGDRRFIALDPPQFLDYDGTEILMIGASADVARELGLRLKTERETAATAEIFTDLKMEKDLHPVAPLFKGKWA